MDRKRLIFLDIERAYACLVMVFGHTFDSILHESYRSNVLFQNYQFFRGLTAPTFLFISGFAFFYATNLKWEKFHTLSSNLYKRIRRIIYLLIIGYLLHFPFKNPLKIFSSLNFERFHSWMNTDILQCIAAILFIMHTAIFLLKKRKYFLRFNFLLLFTSFLLYKQIWFLFFKYPNFPLSYYFSSYLGSIFPIIPWIGFFSLGIIFSYYYTKTKGKNWERNFLRIAIPSFLISFTTSLYFKNIEYNGPLSGAIYLFMKWSLVLMIFSIIGIAVKNLKKSYKLIITAGNETLTIYWLHLVIVYGSAWNRGLYHYIGKKNPLETLAIFFLVFIFSLSIVVLKNLLKSNFKKIKTWSTNYISGKRIPETK